MSYLEDDEDLFESDVSKLLAALESSMEYLSEDALAYIQRIEDYFESKES